MSRSQKSTPQEDLRRATTLLVILFVVTVVATVGLTLFVTHGINMWIWISLILLTLIYGGCWWFYKRQIDAEIREDQAKIEARKGKSRGR